jgi:hypothetical protein
MAHSCSRPMGGICWCIPTGRERSRSRLTTAVRLRPGAASAPPRRSRPISPIRQVMGHKPNRSAKRVFWVVDNGSSHRGQAAVRRLAKAHPNLILLHTPVHASWLNQVEIYFSLVQRKVLTPNDFADLADVERRLLLYQELSNRNPRPFNWRFDREKLAEFLQRVEARRTTANQTLGQVG